MALPAATIAYRLLHEDADSTLHCAVNSLDKAAALEDFSRRVGEWHKAFGRASVAVKRQMLAEVIESVVLCRDKLEINHRINLASSAGKRPVSQGLRFRTAIPISRL